jgi:hypothetical protein
LGADITSGVPCLLREGDGQQEDRHARKEHLCCHTANQHPGKHLIGEACSMTGGSHHAVELGQAAWNGIPVECGVLCAFVTSYSLVLQGRGFEAPSEFG